MSGSKGKAMGKHLKIVASLKVMALRDVNLLDGCQVSGRRWFAIRCYKTEHHRADPGVPS